MRSQQSLERVPVTRHGRCLDVRDKRPVGAASLEPVGGHEGQQQWETYQRCGRRESSIGSSSAVPLPSCRCAADILSMRTEIYDSLVVGACQCSQSSRIVGDTGPAFQHPLVWSCASQCTTASRSHARQSPVSGAGVEVRDLLTAQAMCAATDEEHLPLQHVECILLHTQVHGIVLMAPGLVHHVICSS